MWASYAGWVRNHPWIALIVVFAAVVAIGIGIIAGGEAREVDFAPFTKSEIVNGRVFCHFETEFGYNPVTVVMDDFLGERYGTLVHSFEADISDGKRTLEAVYSETERVCGTGATGRFQSYFEGE